MPSFPGGVPLKEIHAAAADTRPPKGKYSILTTTATQYTRNVGYPGYANAAVQEVPDGYLIPGMFAQVSQGRRAPRSRCARQRGKLKRIWARWRAAGKI